MKFNHFCRIYTQIFLFFFLSSIFNFTKKITKDEKAKTVLKISDHSLQNIKFNNSE